MDQTVRLRDTQLALGFAYLAVAVGATLRHAEIDGLVACGAAGVFAYLTGRTVSSTEIPVRELWRAVGVGRIVVSVAVAYVVLARPSGMLWAQVVMTYCSGNRFRAGDLFRSGRL